MADSVTLSCNALTRRYGARFALMVGCATALAGWFVWGGQIQAATPTLVKPAAPSPAAIAIDSRYKSLIQPLLTKYCYQCHGGGKSKGGLALDQFNSIEAIQNARAGWRTVSDMISQKVMPPDDKPQPTKAEIDQLVKFIDDALDFVDLAAPRNPGFVPIHRLNRTEINNTIRDLEIGRAS